MIEPSDDQIEMAFDAFDSDKSESIEKSEMEEILRRCGVEASKDQIASIFEFFGEEKEVEDGKTEIFLTKDGFSEFIKECWSTLKEANEKSPTQLKQKTENSNPKEVEIIPGEQEKLIGEGNKDEKKE